MPDPIVDTLEVTVAPQIDVDPLTYIVLAAHQSHDLEFPVNGPWLRNQTENTRILTKRAAMEQAIRKDIAENAERTFGLQSNEAISLAIFRDIASPIDRIALAQRGQSDGGVHSWNSTDNSACVNLINTVGRVLDTPKYTRFLNTHEAFKKTLLLINSAFVKEENPDRLREYQREFLSLATDAFERGEPILLFNLDFTQGSNHQQQLEARAQLVFPLDAEQKNTMETIVHRAYEQQNALHPTMDIAKPAIVIGTGAGWAGTELISYTTGEQFDQNAGFLFLPNIIKEKDIFDCTIDLAELPTSALTELAIWRYYITHEIGHAYHLIEDPALHEAETDIPSIMSCLLESRTESASPGSEDNIAITIATIAADLGRQVRAPFAGDETERGYYVSSYFLLNSMVEHGILSISPDKSHIVISKDLDRIDRYITYLQETHGKFHARDPVTLEHIRQSTPSADTTRFIDLLR